jgi:hypothetical protein
MDNKEKIEKAEKLTLNFGFGVMALLILSAAVLVYNTEKSK